MKGTLYTDGGCRPTNPGFAAFGVVLSIPGRDTQRVARYLGWKTNNYAEYCGLLVGTKMAIEAGVSNLVIITDSQLVQGHLMKGWKCNIDELRVLKRECELKLATIPRWDIKWVRRSENKEADKICGEEIERIRALNPWRKELETRLAASRGTLV